MTVAAEPAVYLLHFDRPLAHARHYIGIALDGDPHRRLAEHLAGQGSLLVRAVVAAGIGVDLVLSAPGDASSNAAGTTVMAPASARAAQPSVRAGASTACRSHVPQEAPNGPPLPR